MRHGVALTVRRWMSRPERAPQAATIIALVTDSVWYMLRGHARMLGVHLERDQPVQDLLEQSRAARPD